MNKKEYEKPDLEVVDFSADESIMVDLGPSLGDGVEDW